MARRKVALKYIPHEKTRRETLKKRSKSLMKKAGEVAVLCNIKACVIVYPEGKPMPQVFSSHDDDDAVAIMNRLRTMKDDDPFNKKMDHECFLEKRSRKLQEQALKSEREREENETRLLLHKSMLVGNVGLSVEELTNVECKVDVFLKSIRDRIMKIQGQSPPVYKPSQVQASNANFTIGTIGAPSTYQPQPPTPYVTNNMGDIRDPTMYNALVSSPYVTAKMDTIGAPTLYSAHVSTPYVNGTMDANGAPMVYQSKVPPHQHEEWLELMRSGGGDLSEPIDLGTLSSCPWGGADTGPSPSAFPPM